MPTYTVRWYRPDDRAQFLDLYSDALGSWDHDPEWFDWKYVDNPYVDHVPIVVATKGDELVGARSFFALPMAVSGQECLALQPCDTMVRSDHRRNGLFTRMTEVAIERYETAEPAFFFNFPNDKTLEGNLKLGWEMAGTVPMAYRIENVGPLLSNRTTAPGTQLAGAIGTKVVSGYNQLRTALGPATPSVSVRTLSTTPAKELATVYEEDVPETIHAVRDSAFYQWRLSNPNWRYTTYIAEDGSESVGMIVGQTPAGKWRDPELRRIVDVVPLTDHDTTEPLLRAVLDRIRADSPATDLVAAPSVIPRDLLRSYGFHHSDAPPLSYLQSQRPHVVRSLSSWNPEGVTLTDSGNWTTTFLEMDTG